MQKRNSKCNCNSGKPYKKCHLYKDQGWYQNEQGQWERRTSYTVPVKISS